MTTRRAGGPTILLIDDGDPFIGHVREELSAAGYFVQRAGSGVEALDELQMLNANLILLSLLLPDTDGLILCASLKARTSAPIVLLSKRPREVDRVLALELGALDVLSVPIETHALLARLDAALQETGDARAAEA